MDCWQLLEGQWHLDPQAVIRTDELGEGLGHLVRSIERAARRYDVGDRYVSELRVHPVLAQLVSGDLYVIPANDPLTAVVERVRELLWHYPIILTPGDAFVSETNPPGMGAQSAIKPENPDEADSFPADWPDLLQLSSGCGVDCADSVQTRRRQQGLTVGIHSFPDGQLSQTVGQSSQIRLDSGRWASIGGL